MLFTQERMEIRKFCVIELATDDMYYMDKYIYAYTWKEAELLCGVNEYIYGELVCFVKNDKCVSDIFAITNLN